MFRRISGSPKLEWYTKTASTPILNGNPVALTSGQLINATDATTAHVGVIMRDCISTDSDYATAVKVPVDVPTSDDIFEVDVKVGVTAAAADVGVFADLYVGTGSDSMTQYAVYVDPDTSTHNQVTVIGYISASKLLVKFNSLLTDTDIA